jgi:HAD superfamily hydrolase (TIGR01509 family)
VTIPARPPRAVLFDCDGVIADSEPLHLRVFQEVLAPLGITIDAAEYAERYLGYDDRGVFDMALRRHGLDPTPALVAALGGEKAARFRRVLEADARIYPGVATLVRALAGVPLAVVSGALRQEVEIILGRAGVRDAFAVVVAAEDVTAGKPDPEGFRVGLAALRTAYGELAAADCLVIEDSIAGIAAARATGMRCLAVTTSYPAAALTEADRVVATLEGLTRGDLETVFASGASLTRPPARAPR